MTKSLGSRGARLNTMIAMMALAFAVAIAPVIAAPPVPKEVDPIPMVTIPAGEFLMGNPEGKGRSDEWPQRSVYLNEFAIDQVEVTNARYLSFVAATGHRSPPNPYGIGPLLAWRQSTTRQGDYQRVVAGKQYVDPDDLSDRNPKSRLQHLGLKLGGKRCDVRRIEDLQQPVHGAFLSARGRPVRLLAAARLPINRRFRCRRKIGRFR